MVNFKKRYANKIASGEIDPVETSFADFEAVIEKEYSLLVDTKEKVKILLEGKVDQDEIDDLFDYSENSSHCPENSSDFTNIACLIIETGDEFDETIKTDLKKYAKPLYDYAELLAEDSSDYLELANSVSYEDYLNDKTRAKSLYKKAKEKVIEIEELLALAKGVMNKIYLNDKEWATQLLKEYESKATTFDEVKSLLMSVISKPLLYDQEWGVQIVQKLRPLCKTIYDYVEVINILKPLKSVGVELAEEAILLLETDDQKNELAYSVRYNASEELAEEIENSSIEDLKNKFKR